MMTKREIKQVAAVALTMACVTAVEAKIVPAMPFSQGMVLQRGMPVPVWGTAEPGTRVSVAFAGQTCEAVVSSNGTWRVDLAPMEASKVGRTLVLASRDEKVEIGDVVVGEVWICSGQSNMDMPLAHRAWRYGDGFGNLIAQTTVRPLIRMTQAPDTWHALTPEYLTSGRRSALAVYFALELQATLDVPIGLVQASVGGSRIEPWLAPGGKHYAATLKKVAPYAVRGAIWYQGCSNVDEPHLYAGQMHALHDGWKAAFENPGFKLHFVQLAPWYDEKVVALQLAQSKFAAEEPNASITIINDLGDEKDVHPNNKLLVAKRLAAHAFKEDYGFSTIEADSPTVREWKVVNGNFVLRFDHAKVLVVYNRENNYDAPFEVAGSDGAWKPARIRNFGKFVRADWARKGEVADDFLVVGSDEVKSPVRLRYLFKAPWRGCLYNEVMLPAGAFEVEVNEQQDNTEKGQ